MSTSTPQRQFTHHMLREIYEQPASLTAALGHYVRNGALDEASFGPVYPVVSRPPSGRLLRLRLQPPRLACRRNHD